MTDLPNEEWKDIKDFEGLYQISNYGRVKSLPKIRITHNKYLSHTRILKCGHKLQGYLFVNLYKDKKRKAYSLHNLVANNFLENDMNYPLIMHLDNDKENNHVSNLKFGTFSENIQCAYNDGLHPNIKSIIQFDCNYNIINVFKSITQASASTNISVSSIANDLTGRSKTAGGCIWKYNKERESE